MAKNLTPKQEAFANKYVETSNASEAYRHAYNAENTKPEGVWVNASKVLSNANVALRVFELQERLAERTLVTVESQTRRLQELSVKADGYNSAGGVTASVNAEKEVNKLHGLITDKVAVDASVHVHISNKDAHL